MHGDCLELMQTIPAGSVDLVLTDPPYGTMRGIDDLHDWDTALDTRIMFERVASVVRQNGRCVLFSQEPLTSELVTDAIPSLPFCYRAIWEKDNGGNALMAATAMVSRFEDIVIFTKPGDDYSGRNPLRAYFDQVLAYLGKTRKQMIEEVGQCADHCFRTNSSQYTLCTVGTYKAIVSKYGLEEMPGFRGYDELREVQDKYNRENAPVFNLWQGYGSKPNVLRYAKPTEHYHPTQKPVSLLEDLIRTFSNEGDTVLDFTMGSGSTGVACVRCNRDFIGIERDDHYFEVAQKRIADEQDRPVQQSLF